MVGGDNRERKKKLEPSRKWFRSLWCRSNKSVEPCCVNFRGSMSWLNLQSQLVAQYNDSLTTCNTMNTSALLFWKESSSLTCRHASKQKGVVWVLSPRVRPVNKHDSSFIRLQHFRQSKNSTRGRSVFLVTSVVQLNAIVLRHLGTSRMSIDPVLIRSDSEMRRESPESLSPSTRRNYASSPTSTCVTMPAQPHHSTLINSGHWHTSQASETRISNARTCILINVWGNVSFLQWLPGRSTLPGCPPSKTVRGVSRVTAAAILKLYFRPELPTSPKPRHVFSLGEVEICSERETETGWTPLQSDWLAKEQITQKRTSLFLPLCLLLLPRKAVSLEFSLPNNNNNNKNSHQQQESTTTKKKQLTNHNLQSINIHHHHRHRRTLNKLAHTNQQHNPTRSITHLLSPSKNYNKCPVYISPEFNQHKALKDCSF